MTCLFHKTLKIIYNNCNNYFDWLIFCEQKIAFYPREAVFLLSSKQKCYICPPMDMGKIESYCARLECFERNGRLLHAYCGLSVHATGILYHYVVGEMYFLVYVHWCLQHPLIYKQVRYCNISSIIWVADF